MKITVLLVHTGRSQTDESQQATSTSAASGSSGYSQTATTCRAGCDNGDDEDPPEERPVKVKRK